MSAAQSMLLWVLILITMKTILVQQRKGRLSIKLIVIAFCTRNEQVKSTVEIILLKLSKYYFIISAMDKFCCGVILKSSYCRRCSNPSPFITVLLKLEEELLEVD